MHGGRRGRSVRCPPFARPSEANPPSYTVYGSHNISAPSSALRAAAAAPLSLFFFFRWRWTRLTDSWSPTSRPRSCPALVLACAARAQDVGGKNVIEIQQDALPRADEGSTAYTSRVTDGHRRAGAAAGRS